MNPSDWSAWVTSAATVVLTILTFIYVRITGKILASQSDRCVILTVVPDADRPTIIQLVAKNVGTGLAHDVKFQFSRSLPAKAWGLTEASARESKIMNDGPMIDGIPALGPGETRKLDWGQYGGLKAALGNEPIVATCKFKKGGKDMPPVVCPLDIGSFMGTSAAQSPSAKVAKELEDISKNIQHFTSGYRHLRVEVVSLPHLRNKDDYGNGRYTMIKRSFRYLARSRAKR